MHQAEFPAALAQRYSPGRILGRGAMGYVVAATDLNLHRQVAVKLMNPGLADSNGLARFGREARTLAVISHPNVVRVFDVGLEGRTPYLVMELLSGASLSETLSDGPLPLSDSRQVIEGVLDALAVVHAAGVLHRDLKPSNVMMVGRRPVVVDFGLARHVENATVVTADGQLLGTPRYLAPELMTSAEHTTATDIFAVGALGYEVVTGRQLHALGGASLGELAESLRSGAYFENARVQLAAHGRVGRVLLSALAPDPLERPFSASEMRRALTHVPTSSATGEPASRRAQAAKQRHSPATGSPRGPGSLALAAAAPLVLILLFGHHLGPMLSRTERTTACSDTALARSSSSASATGTHVTHSYPASSNPGLVLNASVVNRLASWDPSDEVRSAIYSHAEELARTHDQPRATAAMRTLIAASHLESAVPGLAAAQEREFVLLQRFYHQVFWRHAAERVGGTELVKEFRVLSLLPPELRPGQPQPAGATFEMDLRRGPSLTANAVLRGIHELDSSHRMVTELPISLVVKGARRAREAWIGITAARFTPLEGVRVVINERFKVTLLTPDLASGHLVSHTLPAWLLKDGKNNFRLTMESLTARRDATVQGLGSLRLVLLP